MGGVIYRIQISNTPKAWGQLRQKNVAQPQSIKDMGMNQSQQMNQKTKHNENLVKVKKYTTGEMT